MAFNSEGKIVGGGDWFDLGGFIEGSTTPTAQEIGDARIDE